MKRKYEVTVKGGGGNKSKTPWKLEFDAENWPDNNSATLEVDGPINASSFKLASNGEESKIEWDVSLAKGRRCHKNHVHIVKVISFTITPNKN
jgi:hypothetical protein